MARKLERWQWHDGRRPKRWQGRARERGGMGAWECVKGVRRCPGGAYIGSGEEGKGLPAAMAINGHAALMGNQEGGLRMGNGRVMAGE
jgi:hypothetical protein